MTENDQNKFWGAGLKARDFWPNFMKKFGRNPGLFWILAVIAALGVILLLTGNDRGTAVKENTPPANQAGQSESREAPAGTVEAKLADELVKILEGIEGAGEVRVQVNFKSQRRNRWERQVHENKRTSQEQNTVNTEDEISNELVFAKDRDGSDRPVLKEELAPEIEGVIVVAAGARDIKLKSLLIKAVTTVLGIPAHRVMVIPGKLDQDWAD